MQVISQQMNHSALQGAIADILIPTTPPGAVVHLAKAPFTPTPISDPTTFAEADFAGYAAITLTLLGTQHPDGANQWFAYSETPPVSFTPSAVLPSSQSIYGYWVVGAGARYVCAEVFGTPFVMRDPTTVLQLVIPFGVGPLKMSATILP